MSLVSTAVAKRDWALFVDWCHAADVDETTVGESEIGVFTREVSGSPAVNQRRLDYLRALRMTPEQRRQPGEESTAAELLRAACGQVLARVAVAGWPGGVQGRRDAFVLVLRGHLGLTRRQVRALAAADLEFGEGCAQVMGRRVRPTPGPGECPVCGLTRWLRTLCQANTDGWRDVRNTMAGQWAAAASEQNTHDCAEPVPLRWRRSQVLVPAIDRHGWVDDHAPINGRALTAVVARPHRLAQDADPGVVLPSVTAAGPAWSRVEQARQIAGWEPLLDRLDTEIEVALARSRALLAPESAAVAAGGTRADPD